MMPLDEATTIVRKAAARFRELKESRHADALFDAVLTIAENARAEGRADAIQDAARVVQALR